VTLRDDVRDLIVELDRLWTKYDRLDAAAHRLEAIVSSVVRERVYFERWIDGRRSLSTLPPRWRSADTLPPRWRSADKSPDVRGFSTDELLARAERAFERREGMLTTRDDATAPLDVPSVEPEPHGGRGEQGPARPRLGHEWARDDDGRRQP